MHKVLYDSPMPTLNPRLSVTLKPSTSAQLQELSRLTGDSQSGIIADILEQSSIVFERLINVLQAAEIAKAELKKSASSDLNAAQGRIEAQLGLMLDDMDSAFKPLLQEAENIRRRSRTAAARDAHGRTQAAGRGESTPLSNRGVRSRENPKQQVKTTTTKGARNGQI